MKYDVLEKAVAMKGLDVGLLIDTGSVGDPVEAEGSAASVDCVNKPIEETISVDDTAGNERGEDTVGGEREPVEDPIGSDDREDEDDTTLGVVVFSPCTAAARAKVPSTAMKCIFGSIVALEVVVCRCSNCCRYQLCPEKLLGATEAVFRVSIQRCVLERPRLRATHLASPILNM